MKHNIVFTLAVALLRVLPLKVTNTLTLLNLGRLTTSDGLRDREVPTITVQEVCAAMRDEETSSSSKPRAIIRGVAVGERGDSELRLIVAALLAILGAAVIVWLLGPVLPGLIVAVIALLAAIGLFLAIARGRV